MINLSVTRADLENSYSGIKEELGKKFAVSSELSIKQVKSLSGGLNTTLSSIMKRKLKAGSPQYSASGKLELRKRLLATVQSETKIRRDITTSQVTGSLVMRYEMPSDRGHPYPFNLGDEKSKWQMNRQTLIQWILAKQRMTFGSAFNYHGEPVNSTELATRLSYIFTNKIYGGGSPPTIKHYSKDWFLLGDTSDTEIQNAINSLTPLMINAFEKYI